MRRVFFNVINSWLKLKFSDVGGVLLFHLIRKLEKKSGLKRRVVVEKLQRFHNVFSALDEVTFCRWVNGTTTPSFYKQLLLISFFSFPMLEFMKMMDYKTVTTRQISAYKKILNMIDNPYHRMSYAPIPIDTATLSYLHLGIDKHWELLGGFYQNIAYASDFSFARYINKFDLDTHVFTISIKGSILSHTSCIFNASYFFEKVNFGVKKVSDRSAFINVSYYVNSDFLEALLGNMLAHPNSTPNCDICNFKQPTSFC